MPYIEQKMCARHIYVKFGKRYSDEDLKYQFWKCGRLTNEAEFFKAMAVLKEKNCDAHDFLISQWDPRTWSLAFASPLSKCDVIDNNMCETFNGVILECRKKPIISMLEEIRIYVMRSFVRNTNIVDRWQGKYGPRIIAKSEKHMQKAAKWEVEWNGGNYHEVYYVNVELDEKESFIVSLRNKTCICRCWDVSGIPCEHAIAAIVYDGKDPVSFLDECYKKASYLKAYEHLMQAVKGPIFWPSHAMEEVYPSKKN